MKITKGQLKRIIREAMHYSDWDSEYGPSGNPAPPYKSNWRSFSDALDIGILDLNAMAYDLGYTDFYDMNRSISPRSLAKRDSASFIDAARGSSSRSEDMTDNEILMAAGVL